MTDYEAYLIARGQLWKQELEAFDGAVVAELLRSMRQIRREVEAQIDALDLTSPADLLDKERLERLEAWIDSVTAAASSITEGIAVEAGISSALASATATAAMLNLDGAISAFRDVGLTREQIAVWYGESAELVEGYSLRGLLQGMSAQAKQTVLDSLRTSVTMGESVAKSVDRFLRDAMEAGLKMTERGAVSTVRTAIQAGAVQAMDKVYEGNRDLIQKWRWIAKLDSRTCPICATLDGQIFEFNEGPPMPRHIRCRCLRQPILRRNANLGIPDADVQRLSRRWIEREKGNIDMGGRKILETAQTDRWFGEWFPSLRPDLQDSIVGKARAEALRSGSISWSDLTDKDGKFRTLKELGLSRIDRRSGKQ